MTKGPLGARLVARLRRELLAWFAEHRRELPWRGTPTPYQVWVSEVMLQQTRVETVKAYYERWMRRFPDIETLARADEGEVLGLWQGLGYYARGRRLLEGARWLVRERAGELPASTEELLEVPGIGPYSAGAIASIAHQKRAPLVDGNVVRVLTRLLGKGGDPARAPLQAELWAHAAELVPAERPGDFNQALMELGALVCTPKSPRCFACPWQGSCVAFAAGETSRYPEKPAAKKATEVDVLVLCLSARGQLAFERLPEDARWWAGLSALPALELGRVTGGALSRAWQARLGADFGSTASPDDAGVLGLGRAVAKKLGIAAPPQLLPQLSHQVTRFKITLRPVFFEIRGKRPHLPGHDWVPASRLGELALPAPHRRLISRWARTN
jgi:A/G-specific adenine glycosylase